MRPPGPHFFYVFAEVLNCLSYFVFVLFSVHATRLPQDRFLLNCVCSLLAYFAQGQTGEAADDDIFAQLSDVLFDVLADSLVGVFDKWLVQ